MPAPTTADPAASLPPAGRIDPRGLRFGAGISAVALVLAFVIDAPAVVPVVLLSIGTSAAFGMRWSIYGAAWRRIVRLLSLPHAEPEHEYPPRFAQTLGSAALTVSIVAFALGAAAAGWALALAVAALQGVLATTGYCLGCRLYFLRWWVPAAVTAVWTRGRRGEAAAGGYGRSISFR